MPDAARNWASQENVIDLTLEDSDDSTPPPVTLSARQSFTSPWRNESNVAISEHGLPLDGILPPSTKWVPEISKLLLPNIPGLAKLPSTKRCSSPPNFVVSQPGSGKLRPTPPYVTNNAKRRRVELAPSTSCEGNRLSPRIAEIPPSPEAEVLQSASPQLAEPASTQTILPSSHLSSAQGRQQNRPTAKGNTINDVAMNESLKVALRKQVFPHINQRLSHYRRAIDSVTRKQLGKKAAWKICGKEFMSNMVKNDGRLSAVFEDKVATMAQSLVDQFAEEVLRNSKKLDSGDLVANDSPPNKEHTSTIPGKDVPNEVLRAEAVRAADQVEAVRAAATQAEAAQAKRNEVTKARTAAKLRAIMKARWESGVMRPAMAKRAARRKLRRKAKEDPSQSIPPKLVEKNQALHHRKENALEIGRVQPDISSNKEVPALGPVPAPIISLDSPDAPDNGATSIPKSTASQSVSLVPLSSNNVRQLATVTTDSQGERKGILKIATGLISKQLTAPCSVQRGPPLRPSNYLFRSKALSRRKPRKKMVTIKINPGPIPSAKSTALTHQLEDLRLAVLDDRVPRPYLKFQDRQDILRGLKIAGSDEGSQAVLSAAESSILRRSIIHVDFCPEEIGSLVRRLELLSGVDAYTGTRNSKAHIESLLSACHCQGYSIPEITSAAYQSMGPQHIPGRTSAAVIAFLEDAAAGLVSEEAAITRIQPTRAKSRDNRQLQESITAILQKREIWGRHRDLRRCKSIKARILCHLEDELTRQAEWMDCSGDIATVSWVDSDRYFCGATTHSDEHNMQYNKPGNLLVGSIDRQMMNSIAGHQIVRPIVARGENASESMRQSQDPWLYSSVTSTVYSHHINKCFTGSYDQTVKIWNISDDGSGMDLCGTWPHSGNVNFVVASQHHSMIATAADVCEDAVRVYQFDPDDIEDSVFTTYEPSVQDRNGNDTWAYFPATMQWGISSTVSQLLLVGYSPRSFDCHDSDIPEDKLNTGELCLWDVSTGKRIPISSGKTQNVFEVIWHPSQPIFVAATSPAGEFENCVRTQLRIFGQSEYGAFTQMKILDCPALDINEITIMPNSLIHCYVTASCTDGNTYVWDSALSDKPIHILAHGDSIDDQVHGISREECDSGVKFAAWGKSSERFYTGSSDGAVKIWNIRAPTGEAFLRDLITLSGGVSTGKFSPDFRQLVIGDSTGKIHLFSIESKAGMNTSTCTRLPITPHAPLPPPLVDEDDQDIPPEQTGPEIGQQFLERQQIIIHPDEYIGAVQGPNYRQTGLFYNAFQYKDEKGQDAEGWSQKELQETQKQRFQFEAIRLPRLPEVESSRHSQHERNLALDLNPTTLPRATIAQLKMDGVDLEFQDEQLEIGQRLERPEKSKTGIFVNEQFADSEFRDDSCNDDDNLDNYEIQELRRLEKWIQQGLTIHRGLRDLL